MSKRSRNIASMFAARPDEDPSRDDGATRVPAVSVRAMRESFTGFERENEELRERLASGAVILEINPALIDPSPISDRFDDDDPATFEILCRSIADRGQEVPVLLRQSPLDPGRYQTAYGHRRIRAARALARTVRAVVRPLSDEDLVIAQGVENSAREDLTFIERALFALRLEQAGYRRDIGMKALSVDQAELSKLLTVARTVPRELVNAIGRAPKVGRLRWQALANAIIRDDYILARLRRRAIEPDFFKRSSDDRFLDLLQVATGRQKHVAAVERSVIGNDGSRVASIARRGRNVRLVVDPTFGDAFAAYLEDSLPAIADAYRADRQLR